MTDRTQDLSPEERVKRLQERRTASSASPRTRRRHPAAKSRALFAGLAIASFGLVGASMAATQAVSTSTVASPPVAQSAAPAVSAVPVSSQKAATAAPAATRSAPVTTTRGS
jgi:anti-sigma factor RsiW